MSDAADNGLRGMRRPSVNTCGSVGDRPQPRPATTERTWTNGASGVAAAFLGASSKLMPTINEKFPPPHGTDHPLVSGSLQVCGVTIMVALLLTLYGLLRSKAPETDANA